MKNESLTRAYSDGEIDTNRSANRPLESIVHERYSRRQTLFGSLGATAAAFLGTSLLAACDEDLPIDGNLRVDAGDTGTTSSGRSITLAGTSTGTQSTEWRQISGPEVQLTDAGSATTTFIAPAVTEPTVLEFELTGTAGNGNASIDTTRVTVNPAELGFTPVPKNKNDIVTVPAGYAVTVMTAVGDPIAAGVPAYRNDGTDADFDRRIGDHGDALHYYGLSADGARDPNSSTRGLLVQNHENLNAQYLHANGITAVNGRRPPGEAIKEIEAHGLSVTEYRLTESGWTYVQDSPFNRRITPNTPVTYHGPVRGTDFLKTVASPDGLNGTGTINNCANGVTGWATNLTCEENWAFYFRRDNSGDASDIAYRTDRELTGLRRYGINSSTGNYLWSTAGDEPMFQRWDARAKDGLTALQDYRNEPNKFGWVVEIDPYNPASAPRKRTALGRMGHEGAWLGRLIPGQKVGVYMGDDSRGEYFYKYVSDASWSAADAQNDDRLAVGDKYLDEGTLYVARFNADGTGTWLPLVFGQVPKLPATDSTPEYEFESQADVLVHTRLAADAVGATPMDRPEWTATNPATGEVYLTLTNNNYSNRPVNGTNAANPRSYNDPKIRPGFEDSDPNATQAQTGNPNGHIIRIRESGDNSASTSFVWDIYLFGADSAQADPENVNLSNLEALNDFSSPDGLWFSRESNAAGQANRPLVWIQTDDGAFTDRTYNQMLAGMPGSVGDGQQVTITNTVNGQSGQQTTFVGAPATSATLRRFLTGPNESEITGVDTTPDGRTLFVGIQHPGEDGDYDNPTSHWPQNQHGAATGRPRSAVVAITKEDGGVVAL